MITVTNDTKDFIENQKGEIFIYGAGNSGYWIGYYLNQCGIKFTGYFDRKSYFQNSQCNGRPVFQPQKLKEYEKKSIRVIVSPKAFETVLSDLLFADAKYGFHALCLVPRFTHFNLQREVYDINHFLGYFRRRLYKGDTPTIISNDCVAGEIYNSMDMLMLSPTINTSMSAYDFLKICQNPEKYFSIEGQQTGHSQILPLGDEPQDSSRGMPMMSVGDIMVTFAHPRQEPEKLVERWNYMRKKVNWKNLIFLLRLNHRTIPRECIREFSRMKSKHLIMNYGQNGMTYEDTDQLFFSDYIFGTDRAIENDFDLLGWMNQEI